MFGVFVVCSAWRQIVVVTQKNKMKTNISTTLFSSLVFKNSTFIHLSSVNNNTKVKLRLTHSLAVLPTFLRSKSATKIFKTVKKELKLTMKLFNHCYHAKIKLQIVYQQFWCLYFKTSLVFKI